MEVVRKESEKDRRLVQEIIELEKKVKIEEIGNKVRYWILD